MQLSVLYIPTGTPFQNKSIAVNGLTDESRFICNNVRINTYRHTSIYHLGAAVILLCSALVTALSLPGKIPELFPRNFHWTWWTKQARAWVSDSIYSPP